MAPVESADQPALGPDGQLLDASKISWYNDPDDPHPIQPGSEVQGDIFSLYHVLATTHAPFSCQDKSVSAHAQSAPLLVHDLRRLSPLRNSTSMGRLADASSNPVMRKHLQNASDPPMRHMAMPSMLIQKTRLTQFLVPRVDAMMTHWTRIVMRLKSEMKRYDLILSRFHYN
jgi:hypothetical protein